MIRYEVRVYWPKDREYSTEVKTFDHLKDANLELERLQTLGYGRDGSEIHLAKVTTAEMMQVVKEKES